jgi:hypothetical protein
LEKVQGIAAAKRTTDPARSIALRAVLVLLVSGQMASTILAARSTCPPSPFPL